MKHYHKVDDISILVVPELLLKDTAKLSEIG